MKADWDPFSKAYSGKCPPPRRGFRWWPAQIKSTHQKESRLCKGSFILGICSVGHEVWARWGDTCQCRGTEHPFTKGKHERACSRLNAQGDGAWLHTDRDWNSYLTICQTVSQCQSCSSRDTNMTSHRHSLRGNCLTLSMKALSWLLHSRARTGLVLFRHRWAWAVVPAFLNQHTLGCPS